MPTNSFYNDFDREELEPREPDYRSVFQRGRDRLIHNAAFRRLQAKTQVFLSGEYDFYRTRLTHSIEVAQIAGSIARYLNASSEHLRPGFEIDLALVESCALAHDIGHPPFGHAGEGKLHELMRPWGGFEGNAQTLRLITEIIFTSGRSRRGMNPTRAFMDGVLKYKTLFSQWENPRNHFLYDDQQRYLDFVFAGRPFPAELTPGKTLNGLRSLECQIMDWADDTAYSLNDLVDSANAGFIGMVQVERWAQEKNIAAEEARFLEGLLESMRGGGLERAMNRKIGTFVEACRLVERDTFMNDLTNRYRFGVELDEAVVREQKLYARLAVELVFRSPQICQLEHKGNHMLARLFQALVENYLGGGKPRLALLSGDFEKEMDGARTDTARARIICDYLAGMTDGFASRIYKRMFDPDFGSIVDLV
ncbi:deoxyguanosinetriphosphate triphosphohydrolase [bacterium DOLJORAL78_65_58]|nr:MAG: deoxyguanosinetriphosphate triphosphohydrolase [bacterium DOLZORAL124_64_63]PIE76392.1 MAG: deoxyguanosinetriphosphate triphosphohydrolase [bacterium DOLJORAL78_65_58]